MSVSAGGHPDYELDGIRRLFAACNEVREAGDLTASKQDRC